MDRQNNPNINQNNDAKRMAEMECETCPLIITTPGATTTDAQTFDNDNAQITTTFCETNESHTPVIAEEPRAVPDKNIGKEHN